MIFPFAFEPVNAITKHNLLGWARVKINVEVNIIPKLAQLYLVVGGGSFLYFCPYFLFSYLCYYLSIYLKKIIS